MNPLEHRFVVLTRRNRDGSQSTQAERIQILRLFARQLYELGYSPKSERNLKLKHYLAVIKLWKDQGVSDRTIANRVAAFRWVGEKTHRENVLPPNNADLGLGKRACNATSRANHAPESALRKLNDPNIRISLALQRYFGLRREEAMKIQPRRADRGDTLVLKGRWTKGGREREIPIRNEMQRDILETAKAIAQNGSLIPAHRSYKEQLAKWEYATAKAGIPQTHGLRHAYAQTRYQELTGWASPHQGGPSRKTLQGQQRELDSQARLTIAEELGHSRISIVQVYLGK